MNELPYCSCVGPHRRGNQPRTKCMYWRNGKLFHVEAAASILPHTPQSRYVPTYLFVLLHNGNLFYPFNSYPYHSLAQTQTQTQTLQAKYLTIHTLPTQNFKLSIHPVRELVASCFRLEIQDSQAASGRGGCKRRGRITLLPIMGNFSKKKKLVLLNG